MKMRKQEIDCTTKDLEDVAMPVVDKLNRVQFHAPNARFGDDRPVIIMLDEFGYDRPVPWICLLDELDEGEMK